MAACRNSNNLTDWSNGFNTALDNELRRLNVTGGSFKIELSPLTLK
jgi:hypothetical protein